MPSTGITALLRLRSGKTAEFATAFEASRKVGFRGSATSMVLSAELVSLAVGFITFEAQAIVAVAQGWRQRPLRRAWQSRACHHRTEFGRGGGLGYCAA